MERTREYYGRRLTDLMDCKPESLAARISATFECFVELTRERRFPDLRQQYHVLLKVQHDLLQIQREAHFRWQYKQTELQQ